MRTALVKQVLDVFGPWRSVRWSETSPVELFNYWPAKALYWELTCMLEADWYVVPQVLENDYIRDSVMKHPGRAEVIKRHTTNVVEEKGIPFEEYDLVISVDPILKPQPRARTVFAYYMQEHWDRIYTASLRRPVESYDLFLAHMMDAQPAVSRLPQALSFPYVHDAKLARAVFPEVKQEQVWIDARTLTTLAMKDLGETWGDEVEAAAQRLQSYLDVKIRYRGQYLRKTYAFADPPTWGDAAVYFRDLAQCKYYVAVGQIGGAGQGLGDAASVGCICIGQADKAYHRLICHPQCLCADMAEMPERLHRVAGSRELQEQALEWQDRALARHFKDEPLDALARAAELKAPRREPSALRAAVSVGGRG
jgi:hypothetical protein